jgi:hypothetical protein
MYGQSNIKRKKNVYTAEEIMIVIKLSLSLSRVGQTVTFCGAKLIVYSCFSYEMTHF